MVPRLDFVVPVAVEFVASDLNLFEFLIGDFDSSRVSFGIEFGVDFETGRGGCTGDKADDRFEAS